MKKYILLFLCSILIAQTNIVQTHITMVSTSNVFAEYYDCGCPNNPLGGLARKAHFINTQMILFGSVFIIRKITQIKAY